jgi:hypothetical protein
LVAREYESGTLVSGRPSWVLIALLFLKYAINTNNGSEAEATSEPFEIFRLNGGDD